jgi:hypothetical protein
VVCFDAAAAADAVRDRGECEGGLRAGDLVWVRRNYADSR